MTHKRVKMFNQLKESFESACDLEEHGFVIEYAFEHDEDDRIQVIAKCKSRDGSEVWVRLRIEDNNGNGKMSMYVEEYEENWETWNEYDAYSIKHLWKALFFSALDEIRHK